MLKQIYLFTAVCVLMGCMTKMVQGATSIDTLLTDKDTHTEHPSSLFNYYNNKEPERVSRINNKLELSELTSKGWLKEHYEVNFLSTKK